MREICCPDKQIRSVRVALNDKSDLLAANGEDGCKIGSSRPLPKHEGVSFNLDRQGVNSCAQPQVPY